MFSFLFKKPPIPPTPIDYSKFDSGFPHSFGFTEYTYKYKSGWKFDIDQNMCFVMDRNYTSYYRMEVEVCLSTKEVLVDEKKMRSDIESLLSEKITSDYFIVKTYRDSGAIFYIKIGNITDISQSSGRAGANKFLRIINLQNDIKNIIYNNIIIPETFTIDTILDQLLDLKETHELSVDVEKNPVSYIVNVSNINSLDTKLKVLERISKMYNIIQDSIINIDVISKNTNISINIYPKLKSYVAI